MTVRYYAPPPTHYAVVGYCHPQEFYLCGDDATDVASRLSLAAGELERDCDVVHVSYRGHPHGEGSLEGLRASAIEMRWRARTGVEDVRDRREVSVLLSVATQRGDAVSDAYRRVTALLGDRCGS